MMLSLEKNPAVGNIAASVSDPMNIIETVTGILDHNPPIFLTSLRSISVRIIAPAAMKSIALKKACTKR